MNKISKDQEVKMAVEKKLEKTKIAEEIIKARENAQMTQVALAGKTKTTRSAISRYESGRYDSYSVPLLRRIAKACDTELQVKFIPRTTKTK